MSQHSDVAEAVPVALSSGKADGVVAQESLAVLLFACCLPADCAHASCSLQKHCVHTIKPERTDSVCWPHPKEEGVARTQI